MTQYRPLKYDIWKNTEQCIAGIQSRMVPPYIPGLENSTLANLISLLYTTVYQQIIACNLCYAPYLLAQGAD